MHASVYTSIQFWLTFCRLVYDNKSDSYSDTPSVNITAPGLGDVITLEYLEADGLKLLPYFEHFVDYFVTNYSYVGGKDLRGAPYDWRLAPGMQCIIIGGLKNVEYM